MKNSYNQLNDFPKERVRSSIMAGIAQAENQNEKKKKSISRYRKMKRKILFAAGSVAVLFGILIGSSNYSPALASSLSQIPIIGSVFGDSNLIGLKQAQKKGLASNIRQTQTVNGISVTIDQILYDQNGITIGFGIESEKPLSEDYFGAGMDFMVNGKLPNGAGWGYEETVKSPTVRTAIQDIDVDEEIPDAFELGLVLNGEHDEKWYFSVPVKKITDIKQIPVQHTQQIDGIKLKVTDLKISETGIGISYESTEKETDFELSRGNYIEFLVVDQDGREITNHYGGIRGEKVKNSLVYKSTKKLDPIDASVKELTITPYLDLPKDGGGVEMDENGEERELEFKGNTLQPVEFESFKVKIPEK